MKLKSIILVGILSLTGAAQAQDALDYLPNATVTDSLTMVSPQDVNEYKDQIVNQFGLDTFEATLDAVKAGFEITLTYKKNLEDPRDPPECGIKITEKTSGGGGVSVGKGIAGGEARGSGSHERTIEAKVPCKDVGGILRDLVGAKHGKP